ncbi:hypothetical protein TpMuguga_04g00275 [Theileria parva strain Muguga]|uniref:uncharacterized protein n=1 Tax=Theileria parva strain Muguga TaxID=333668 RepID=UPI001C618A10|nr:uncharacterized protein TpMuguga_04g00275 [Theileria parva strain Muguga]EAN31627.2 hypothetical protein TpMuguga_04g00275 [Theileria parva strain Muguga]
MTEIPLSESCQNRDSKVLNLYYLNHKPAMFNFDTEVYGPDGTLHVKYKISVDYNPKVKMSYIKEEILNRLLKDGHILSPNELFFIKLSDKKGRNVTDDMLLNEVVDVMQEQRTATLPLFRIAVNPQFDVVYRDRDGHYDKFRVEMNKTNPTKRDFTEAVDEKLHEKHILRPEEHIRTVKVHPMNKKKKINFNVDLNTDENGHFPPGTRADQITAETDLRMEIPVEFEYDNGRVLRFTVNADYGASDEEIERLVRKALKKKGYKGHIPGLHFDIKNSKHNEMREFWEGGPEVDKFVLNTGLARDVEVDGDVHGMEFTTHVKVHPRESMNELRTEVLKSVRHNPKIRSWLEEDPRRMEEIYTVVSDSAGKIYEDDELGTNGLYDRSSRIRIGVSDHPFEMIWKDPLTGREYTFCLSKDSNGRCRPLPPKLVKFPIQDFIDHLISILKKEGKYEELVIKPLKTGKLYTQGVRLKEVRTVDGRRLNCDELPTNANFRLIESALNVHVSEIRSMVFILMTSDESDNLSERQRNHGRYKVVISKDSGDKESHLINADYLSPSEVRNLIYKNFSSVPSYDDIEDLRFYDDHDHDVNFEDFIKRKPKQDETMKIRFTMKEDGSRPPMPTFENVVIQPKPRETIREFFLRAVEEPIDFGLSPMHSYTVIGFDENDKPVHFDEILDVPIKDLKNVKKVKFVKQAAVRPDGDININYGEGPPTNTPNEVTVEFDNMKEPHPTLNSKIRNFLIQVPPEQMGHVRIEVDGKELKCSLETLRDAYMIKNLTVEKLFALCQGVDRQKDFSHVKMNFKASPEEMKKSEAFNLLNGLGSPSGSPIAKFTLYKGQMDLGLSTLVKINVGTLNSPVAEFYSKIVQMFGDSVDAVNDISISLIKNGRMYPCNNTKILKKLKDFGKANLSKVFEICNLPAVIPENGSYFHFHVSIDLSVGPKTGYDSSMGSTIPMDIYYDEEDRMTNVHYDENLYPDIAKYIDDNEDIDSSQPSKYKITIKGEEPSHNFVTKTYTMEDMPHNITLNTLFPDTKVDNLNITIESKDGHNSGGWRSETVHPVNDFKTNFDALKRQIILNLKTMHGNNLDAVNSYVVKVGINGVKHQCRVESLAKLVKMSLNEFLKNCVNIENVNNNPTMSFGVNYEPSIHGDLSFNVKVVCGDKAVFSAQGLRPKDGIPGEMIEKLKSKYGKYLDSVQWGVYINKVQGDCRFIALLDIVDMRSVLNICGVEDGSLRVYNLVFYDMNYETFKIYNRSYSAPQKGSAAEFPDVTKVTQSVNELKSPVRISMPYSYTGPDIKVNGAETLNDFLREIVNNEDEFNPGNPFKVNVHTNYGVFGIDELPKGVSNHPSRDLGGTYSFIIEDDPEGNGPGTALNLHFPDTQQTLGDFLEDLRNNPSNSNKKFYFSSKSTFLPSYKVPEELLHHPIDELKKKGFFITVVNDSKTPEKVRKLSVNILSKDGVSASDQISNLQQPLTNLFAKISKNQGDLDKILVGKFKVIVDGFERDCKLENLGTSQNGMTLESLLEVCGVSDLDHVHVLTLFFETPISQEKNHENLKFDVDLNDKPQASKNVDYGSTFTVGKDVEDFLKSKKDAHVYLDAKGKDNFKDFVEIDSIKFLQLLNGHPEVVDMLLRLGIPQTHLGSLDALHLIVSNLTQSLKGHQTYNIDMGEDAPYEINKPVSAYKDLVNLRNRLDENPLLRIKGIFTLADGSKQEFDIRGREFMHAVDGNLTFRDVALRALSSEDANNVIHVNFSSYESDEENSYPLASRRKIFKKTKNSPSPAKLGVLPPGIRQSSLSSGSESESLKRSRESVNSENAAPYPPKTPTNPVGTSSEGEIKPHKQSELGNETTRSNGSVGLGKSQVGSGNESTISNASMKGKSESETGNESNRSNVTVSGKKSLVGSGNESTISNANMKGKSESETGNESNRSNVTVSGKKSLVGSGNESTISNANMKGKSESETGNESNRSNESVGSEKGGNKGLTSDESMSSVDLFNRVIRNPEKKVLVKVKTRTGRSYDIIVKGTIIRKGIQSGDNMKKLLQKYLMSEDLDEVNEIIISEKVGSTFTVPLKKHVNITLPVMASDEPLDGDIQDFKNPWNPPENDWKNFTVKSALEGYANANKITKKPKAVYLLNKEDHNNLSAEIIFDEENPEDDKKLDRKVGDAISKGRTFFIRYKDTGELAD